MPSLMYFPLLSQYRVLISIMAYTLPSPLKKNPGNPLMKISLSPPTPTREKLVHRPPSNKHSRRSFWLHHMLSLSRGHQQIRFGLRRWQRFALKLRRHPTPRRRSLPAAPQSNEILQPIRRIFRPRRPRLNSSHNLTPTTSHWVLRQNGKIMKLGHWKMRIDPTRTFGVGKLCGLKGAPCDLRVLGRISSSLGHPEQGKHYKYIQYYRKYSERAVNIR